MNIIEIKIKKFIDSVRPPVHIRDQVDVGYKYENNTFEIFEIRPLWDNKKELVHSPIAKTKFIKSRGVWIIYWMRSSGKWERYEPIPEVKDISDFFKVIEDDQHGCFWG